MVFKSCRFAIVVSFTVLDCTICEENVFKVMVHCGDFSLHDVILMFLWFGQQNDVVGVEGSVCLECGRSRVATLLEHF